MCLPSGAAFFLPSIIALTSSPNPPAPFHIRQVEETLLADAFSLARKFSIYGPFSSDLAPLCAQLPQQGRDIDHINAPGLDARNGAVFATASQKILRKPRYLASALNSHERRNSLGLKPNCVHPGPPLLSFPSNDGFFLLLCPYFWPSILCSMLFSQLWPVRSTRSLFHPFLQNSYCFLSFAMVFS